jgi:hypothetical protein
MFLFCAPILVSNERRNEEKMSVVIHALLFACNEVKLHNSVAKSSSSPRKGWRAKRTECTSILFDGANTGGTKKAMHTHTAQRTKPSLQILKNLSMWENVVSGP